MERINREPYSGNETPFKYQSTNQLFDRAHEIFQSMGENALYDGELIEIYDELKARGMVD